MIHQNKMMLSRFHNIRRVVPRNRTALCNVTALSVGNDEPGSQRWMCQSSKSFLDKIKGVKDAARPPVPDWKFVALSGLGGMVGIGSLSVLHYVITDMHDYTLILGSFGATAVLVFGAPAAPFSQPRHVIGGHLISAFAGITSYKLFGTPGLDLPALAVPMAAASAIIGMQITNTVHPPAGGTALIAVMGSPVIHSMGYGLLAPTFLGSVILVGNGLLFNNMFRGDKVRYPQYW